MNTCRSRESSLRRQMQPAGLAVYYPAAWPLGQPRKQAWSSDPWTAVQLDFFFSCNAGDRMPSKQLCLGPFLVGQSDMSVQTL